MKYTLLVVCLAALLSACAGNARKNAPWQDVSNASAVMCPKGNASGMLFVSRLREDKSRTDLAPESKLVTDAVADTANTFIVRKRLRRYIPSMSDYSTLSALEVTVEFREEGNNLVLLPIKKKEYQVSMVGEWPIPKLDMQELAAYFGLGCKVQSN